MVPITATCSPVSGSIRINVLKGRPAEQGSIDRRRKQAPRGVEGEPGHARLRIRCALADERRRTVRLIDRQYFALVFSTTSADASEERRLRQTCRGNEEHAEHHEQTFPHCHSPGALKGRRRWGFRRRTDRPDSPRGGRRTACWGV